jgi:hypothetical protein
MWTRKANQKQRTESSTSATSVLFLLEADAEIRLPGVIALEARPLGVGANGTSSFS